MVNLTADLRAACMCDWYNLSLKVGDMLTMPCSVYTEANGMYIIQIQACLHTFCSIELSL